MMNRNLPFDLSYRSTAGSSGAAMLPAIAAEVCEYLGLASPNDAIDATILEFELDSFSLFIEAFDESVLLILALPNPRPSQESKLMLLAALDYSQGARRPISVTFSPDGEHLLFAGRLTASDKNMVHLTIDELFRMARPALSHNEGHLV